MKRSRVRIGYMPLTDSLPLAVAREAGYFAAEGLDVDLRPEWSWASLRDRLLVGRLDAASMLAPMLLATSLGLGSINQPLTSAFSMGLNGNAVTVSPMLFHGLRALAEGPTPQDMARALNKLVAARSGAGGTPLVLAVVFPYSCHAYQLRHWLTVAGLNPDQDVKLVVLPPSQMVDHLRLGHIDGFCVGEPWNSLAALTGAGHCLLSGYQIWENAPEKVLAVTRDWAASHGEVHAALLRALHRAAVHADQHLLESLELLAHPAWLDVPAEVIRAPFTQRLAGGLTGQPYPAHHFHVFSAYQANFPWRSDARFLLGEMQRWRQCDVPRDGTVAAQCYRSDLFRQALTGLTNLPLEDDKPGQAHAAPWQMSGRPGRVELGPDRRLEAVTAEQEPGVSICHSGLA
ncbi:nitrate-binding protein NasS [Alcanivorax sp. N3-2A]|nr:nitrate-binding protein NasS [Alcanivorax sp. N3-2A]|tara:strand:- start:5205 stop:6410 length:1206 start_codon:yes stop_codon:yes gene_type:complete